MRRVARRGIDLRGGVREGTRTGGRVVRGESRGGGEGEGRYTPSGCGRDSRSRRRVGSEEVWAVVCVARCLRAPG